MVMCLFTKLSGLAGIARTGLSHVALPCQLREGSSAAQLRSRTQLPLGNATMGIFPICGFLTMWISPSDC